MTELHLPSNTSHILIITDAWHPQVNGVVRTLEHLIFEGELLGAKFSLISPQEFTSFPMPGYSEIRLALCSYGTMKRKIEAIKPNFIHIATEGPLGMLARKWCLKHKQPFTTAYHTQFPEYLRARLPVPLKVSYAWLRRFHNKGVGTFVPSPSMQQRLLDKGFIHAKVWGRGVNIEQFKPIALEEKIFTNPSPIYLYVGRVAVEKNIEAFLKLQLNGTKIVVGDGPSREKLQSIYRDVIFLGALHGDKLAKAFASADVFVFPSLTDTLGLVNLEALACGTPVAAFPVTGPKDIIINGKTGILNENLEIAALEALNRNRADCRAYAEQHSWKASAQEFLTLIENSQLSK